MTTAARLSVTRVINPCVLIEVDDAPLLTDPYFRRHRGLLMNEPIGFDVDRLPPLRAVLGGHGAFDHWQLGPLRGKVAPEIPVLVANRRMRDLATSSGFVDVRVTGDGEENRISPTVSVTTVSGDRVMRSPTNHYIVSGDAGTVYVGTEARSLAPMRRVSGTHRIDVAILPIDGLTFAGNQLVMSAATAIEAALVLGARVLVPLHYSQRSMPPLIRCRSGIEQLLALATSRIEVRHAPTGVPIRLE